MNCPRSLFIAAGLVLVAAPACAQSSPKTFAQVLLDKTLAKHPEMNALTFHVTPSPGADNVVVASNFTTLGKKADDDDMAIVNGKKVEIGVAKSGDRFGVGLQMLSATGKIIGSMNIGFKYQAGDDTTRDLLKAEAIRDEVAKQIPDEATLMKPAS